MYLCTHMQTPIHTCAHTYTHMCTYLYTHMHIPIHTYAYTYTHICIYLYTHMHIPIHTYAHTYTHIGPPKPPILPLPSRPSYHRHKHRHRLGICTHLCLLNKHKQTLLHVACSTVDRVKITCTLERKPESKPEECKQASAPTCVS